MIITILAILLLCVGILLFNLKINNDLLTLFGVISFFIGAVATFVCIMIISIEQIGKDVNYQNTLYEKEVLEHRIENANDNIVGNEMLYNDIVEFNNSLRSTKKWADNPFVNWFWNDDIAQIDYIEFME